MGATADASTKVSQALTEIGADLASVKNLEFNDVWNDMASGITGMSRALDKYGINIRVANLQQELYNLGIDATVSSLSQSDAASLPRHNLRTIRQNRLCSNRCKQILLTGRRKNQQLGTGWFCSPKA